MFTLLLASYLGIGLVIAIWIIFSDAAHSRLAGVRILGDIASLGSLSYLAYLALWPIWLVVLLALWADAQQEKEEIGKKKAELSATDNPDNAQ